MVKPGAIMPVAVIFHIFRGEKIIDITRKAKYKIFEKEFEGVVDLERWKEWKDELGQKSKRRKTSVDAGSTTEVRDGTVSDRHLTSIDAARGPPPEPSEEPEPRSLNPMMVVSRDAAGNVTVTPQNVASSSSSSVVPYCE